MVHFYCPKCWSDFAEDLSVCPVCGFSIRESWDAKSMEEKLLSALNHPDSETVMRAIWLLGEKRFGRAVGPLISLFERSTDVYLAIEIVRALGKIGTPGSLGFLKEVGNQHAQMVKDEIRLVLNRTESNSRDCQKMSDSSKKAEFSDTHLRKLSVALLLLDETLNQYGRWVNDTSEESVLYKVQNDLASEQRKLIRDTIRKVSVQIEEIRDEFELKKDTTSVRHNILASNAWLRNILLDLESKRMKGGGAVPPNIAEYLDGKIKVILEMLDGISEAIRQKD